MTQNLNPYGDPSQSLPPYGNAYGPLPQQKSSSGCLWGVIVLVVVLGGGLMVACCGGLFYFGKSTSEAELLYSVRDNPVIRQHLGEVKKVTMNLVGTGARDDDAEVYDIEGTKGTGEIVAFFDDDLNFVSGTLRLPSGETFEID